MITCTLLVLALDTHDVAKRGAGQFELGGLGAFGLLTLLTYQSTAFARDDGQIGGGVTNVLDSFQLLGEHDTTVQKGRLDIVDEDMDTVLTSEKNHVSFLDFLHFLKAYLIVFIKICIHIASLGNTTAQHTTGLPHLCVPIVLGLTRRKFLDLFLSEVLIHIPMGCFVFRKWIVGLIQGLKAGSCEQGGYIKFSCVHLRLTPPWNTSLCPVVPVLLPTAVGPLGHQCIPLGIRAQLRHRAWT